MFKKLSVYLSVMFLSSLGLLLLLQGCGQVSDSGSVSEENKVESAILASDYFTETVATDENSDVNVSVAGASVGDPVHGWRRILNSASRSFSITVAGNEATVNVVTLFYGSINIYNVTENALTSQSTTYDMKDSRWVHLVKSNNQWVVTKISPTLVSLVNSANQTVSVPSVVLKGQDVSGNPLVVTFNNATQMISVADLPVFKSGTLIVAEATVTNSSASVLNPAMFTFIHHPSSVQVFMATREKMYDDGLINLNPFVRRVDLTAADGVYTRAWYAGIAGRRHAWVDVIDSRILSDPVGNSYNSGGLVVPYRVL